MILPVLAYLSRQIAGRVYARVQHNGPATGAFGDPGGIVAAQRRSDDGQRVGRTGICALVFQNRFGQGERQLGGGLRAGRQLRADPVGCMALRGQQVGEQRCLERGRRRPEAMEIKNMHGGGPSNACRGDVAGAQPIQQQVVDATEAAVAHDQDVIAGLGCRAHGVGQNL